MVDRYEDIADEFILSVMQTVAGLVAAIAKSAGGLIKLAARQPALFVAAGGLTWLWWAHGRVAVIVTVVLAVVGASRPESGRADRVSTARCMAVSLVGARHVCVSAEVAVGGIAARLGCSVSLRAARSDV